MAHGAWVLRFVEGKYASAEFPVGTRSVVIGSAPDLDMVIRDEHVSGRHARIASVDGGTWIEDLASEHGTYVNGERIQRVALAAGDRVRIGTHTFEVRDARSVSREP